MQWHDIQNPQDPELDRLAALFHLHPLHVEDCRHRDQNAKIEEHDNYLFVVLKPVTVTADGSLELADLDLFLGRDFLITVQEGDCPPVRRMLDGVRASASTLRPDQLFYRLVDGVVDSYLPTLDYFDDVIDELEDAVLKQASPQVLSRIFDFKRSLILLRRVLANTRDMVGHLHRIETGLVQRDMQPFLRDIYDHLARNLDTVEMLRDLLNGSLDIYLSSVTNRTNLIMKVLTVLGTVTLPVLLISSFYGMNLKSLPGSDSPHGTLIVSAIMLVSTAVLLVVLRIFKWF